MNIEHSIPADAHAFTFRPSSPTLARALTTYVSDSPNRFNRPHTNNQDGHETENLLNIDSRVTIAAAKFPSEEILCNYSALQLWFYMHANKHAPIDICQALTRLVSLYEDDFSRHIPFNVHLICAEVYQTVGFVSQAYNEYAKAEFLGKRFDRQLELRNNNDLVEYNEKRTKLGEIAMKLDFQSQFQRSLVTAQTYDSHDVIDDLFFPTVDDKNLSAEKCRQIWRKTVLRCVENPRIAISGAQALFAYAMRLHPNTLQYGNLLYVAVNLFLFGYGSNIFHERSDLNIFEILDDIGRNFLHHGNQSKQFSPVHKMAHVWGAAAVAFYVKSKRNEYLICASVMRASFESLGIGFLSSGIESLYILARKHAPEFFSMMAYSPCVKLISPSCINYIRQQLERNPYDIPYSAQKVNEFVLEVFTVDQTDSRL